MIFNRIGGCRVGTDSYKYKSKEMMLISGTPFDLNVNVPLSQLHLFYENVTRYVGGKIYAMVLKN